MLFLEYLRMPMHLPEFLTQGMQTDKGPELR